MTDIITVAVDGVLVTGSDVIAEQVENQHKNVLELIRRNLGDLEEFGRVAFETRKLENVDFSRPTRVALLNEQQATLLMTYLRNSEIVRAFKKRLVKEFYRMRQELEAGKPAFEPSSLSRMDILRLAMDSEEERQRLATKVEEDAPKVEFHDAVAKLDGTMSVAEAAQSLGTGRNTLFRFLKQEGWVIAHERNRPYQHVIKAGLMDLKLAEITRPNGTIKEVITPLITAKGFIKLQKDWKVAA